MEFSSSEYCVDRHCNSDKKNKEFALKSVKSSLNYTFMHCVTCNIRRPWCKVPET